MKVLVISHMYPSTFNEVAGIFVHEQVKALVQKGVEVRVVSSMPWAPFPISKLTRKWRAYRGVPNKAVWEGIPVYYPRYLAFPRSWFFASSGQRMYTGIKNLIAGIYREFPFDLIHAHVVLPDGYAAVKLKQRYGKPVIVTIHGQDLQVTLYKSKRCRTVLSHVFEKADRIVIVSDKLRKIAEKSLGYAEKIVTIGNGVAVDKLAPAGQSGTFKNSGSCRTILSVSYLIPQKGIEFNLRAFAKIAGRYPDLKYAIIGDGPEKARLEALASNLGIAGRVEFLGRLPHTGVLAHMAKADVFSLPGWNEAFGVVYIEAMAFGKPVVGCTGEGLEDFVEHGKTGMLVKPRDVDSLIEALDFLLSHPEEARAMGERARRLVLENYTWEKNAEKSIRVYKEVLYG